MNRSRIFIILILILLCFFNLEAKKEWVLVKPHTNEYEHLETISCSDSLNCYAFLNFIFTTEIIFSSDQGNTWETISSIDVNFEDDLYNINNVVIKNGNNIYIDYSSRIALEVSEDFGNTYRVAKFGEISEIDATFDNIEIYTDSISVGLTYGETIIFTYDNWNTFELVDSPDSISIADPIYYIDSNNIAFARYKNGYNTEFLRFNTLDKSYHVWSQGSESGEDVEMMTDVFFVNDTVGYMTGLQFTGHFGQSTSLVWKTTDKGRNWRELVDSLYDPEFGLDQAAFRTEDHGIVIGGFGKILETTDGGESWFQHELDPQMKGSSVFIEWAGSIPLYYSHGVGGGIYRLETVTEVEELSSDEKFRVYQSGHNLEIAINDSTHKQYSFELYSQTGQRLLSRSVGSSFGFIFQPVELIELSNGAYFYVISSDLGVEFSGKLIVAE